MLLPDRHSLVMHQSNAWQRGRTVAWVADALARGDKVLHRTVDPRSLVAELGPAGRAALETGQLEIVDPVLCHVETDGLHWALRQLHEDMVRAAFDAGYAGVVFTADERAQRLMTPEPAERLAHEFDMERLTALTGVRSLCCYDLRVEQPDLLDAVAGVHYRHVDDVLWSARLSGDRLLVRGEIDADNAGRFAATLRGAAAHGVHTVDLAEVTLLSAAGIRTFDGTVELLERRAERLRLVNVSPTVYRALSLLRVANGGRVEVVPNPALGREPVDFSDTQLGTIARELTRLTSALLEGPTVATVLRRICDAVVELVPGADLVSVTLRSPDGAFHTPVMTDELAKELDLLQYTLNEGPCLDAARVPGPAVSVSEDLATEPAWPQFGPAAAGHGLRSVLSTALLPDVAPPRLSGALNVYSRRVGGISGTDRDISLILASYASMALATTEAITLQELELAQLRKAIDNRDVIGQAKGILMQRRGISADEAFELLRGLSQGMNVKLADVARTLATRHAELDGRERIVLPQVDG